MAVLRARIRRSPRREIRGTNLTVCLSAFSFSSRRLKSLYDIRPTRGPNTTRQHPDRPDGPAGPPGPDCHSPRPRAGPSADPYNAWRSRRPAGKKRALRRLHPFNRRNKGKRPRLLRLKDLVAAFSVPCRSTGMRPSSQACGIKGRVELARLIPLLPEFPGPQPVPVPRRLSRLYFQLGTNIGTQRFVELLESG